MLSSQETTILINDQKVENLEKIEEVKRDIVKFHNTERLN